MAIYSGVSASAKLAMLSGMANDKFMVALYGGNAALSPLTDAYTSAGEVKGQGYKAGGIPLRGFSCGIDGVTACATWTENPTWNNATINARAALIYNASRGNEAVAVIDLGQDVISTNGRFMLQMPPLGATTSVLRIS